MCVCGGEGSNHKLQDRVGRAAAAAAFDAAPNTLALIPHALAVHAAKTVCSLLDLASMLPGLTLAASWRASSGGTAALLSSSSFLRS